MFGLRSSQFFPRRPSRLKRRPLIWSSKHIGAPQRHLNGFLNTFSAKVIKGFTKGLFDYVCVPTLPKIALIRKEPTSPSDHLPQHFWKEPRGWESSEFWKSNCQAKSSICNRSVKPKVNSFYGLFAMISYLFNRNWQSFSVWKVKPKNVRSVKPKRSIRNRSVKPKVRSRLELSSQKFDHDSNCQAKSSVVFSELFPR